MLKIGLLGCGRIGPVHALSIGQRDDVQMTALADASVLASRPRPSATAIPQLTPHLRRRLEAAERDILAALNTIRRMLKSDRFG